MHLNIESKYPEAVQVNEKNLKEVHLNYSSDYQQPRINKFI